MVSSSAKITRWLVVCLPVLSLLLGSLHVTSLSAEDGGQGGNTCTTPDPFVVLGGGTCVNGGWLPPGVVTVPQIPIPPQEPTPAPPQTTSGTGCPTPDPFLALGGGSCVNGGWLPPGAPVPLPPPSTSPEPPVSTPPPVTVPNGCSTPDPFVWLGGGVCVNGGWLPAATPAPTPAPPPPPSSPSTPQVPPAASCGTPDPFAAIGGGVCVNGGWLPAGAAPPSDPEPLPSSPTPPAPPPPLSTDPTGCTTPDPFASLGGGVCINGGWVPSSSLPETEPGSGGSTSGNCTGTDPFAPLGGGVCVNGGWSPGATLPVEVRVTGIVREWNSAWYVQSGSGVRYLPAAIPLPFRVDGLSVTFSAMITSASLPGEEFVRTDAVQEIVATPLAPPAGLLGSDPFDDLTTSIATATGAAAKRTQLRQYTWGTATIPSEQPAFVFRHQSPMAGLENVRDVDTLLLRMDGGRTTFAHHFVPARSNNRAVVLHQGHVCSFDDGTSTADVGLGMRRTLNALLGQGYAVVTVYMPHHATFRTPGLLVDDCSSQSHDGLMNEVSVSSGSPLKFFLSPTAMVLNYLDATYDYDDYSMVGLSGGGWTTTVYAAVDPRIRTSVHVAGALPLVMQPHGQRGDGEQVRGDFYRLASYPDLFVLGSIDPGRRQLQVLVRADDCCFGEAEYSSDATGLSFEDAVRHYERSVRGALKAIGSGEFRVEIDDAGPGHMVSWNTIQNWLLPELGGSGRPMITSSDGDLFERGSNGNLWRMVTGTWSDTGLSIAGGGASVRVGGNLRLFYRGPGNHLMMASAITGGWDVSDLQTVLISDPAVVVSGDRIIVVAIDKSYQPVHWQFDASGVWTGVMASDAPTFVAGRPRIVVEPGGRLNLFVQRRGTSELLQFWSDSYHPWVSGASPF